MRINSTGTVYNEDKQYRYSTVQYRYKSSQPSLTGAPRWSQRAEQQARAGKVWPGAGQCSLTGEHTDVRAQYFANRDQKIKK